MRHCMRWAILLMLTIWSASAWAGYTFNTGTTSKIVTVRMYQTDGTPDTGLAFGDMTIAYVRNEDATDVDVTEQTMTLGTWASGGFIEVDATNSPGVYQFGLVDASLADGAESVEYTFAASGALTRGLTIQLIDVDLRAGTKVDADVIDWTGTAVAAPATAGYVYATIKDGTGTGEIDTLSGSVVNVDLVDLATTTTSVTDQVTADVTAISGDSTAANNLELQYDTNGLSGPTFPGTQAQVTDNTVLIESQRGAHTMQGNIYYVDPVNGNDTTGDGTRLLPYATIQAAHDDLVTAANHDVIWLVAGNTSSPTTHTVAAITTISKSYTFVRGPGRDFLVTRTGAGDTINVTGDGVELSGFRVETAATGSGDGVEVLGADFAKVSNCWFTSIRGDAIKLSDAEYCQVVKNKVGSAGVGGASSGIEINAGTGNSSFNVISGNSVFDITGDGILITDAGGGNTITHTFVKANVVSDCTGTGINTSGSNVSETILLLNTSRQNTSADYADTATNTTAENNEQWAKHSIATELRLAELDAGNLPTDVAAVPTAVENRTEMDSNSTQIAAILLDTGTTLPATIAALENLSGAEVLALVIDGAVDLETALKRILSVVANDVDHSGTTTITSPYRNSADDATVVTHTTTNLGTNRAAAF